MLEKSEMVKQKAKKRHKNKKGEKEKKMIMLKCSFGSSSAEDSQREWLSSTA